VIPDSRNVKREIIIPKNKYNNAEEGDKVLCRIINPEKIEDKNYDLGGEIVKILGKAGNEETEYNSLLYKFGLEEIFPDEVIKEVQKRTAITDIKNREDYRDKICFTIDPEDAKDYDDAVSLELTKDNNYLLGVHISDVSEYVRENTALDREAFRRGTSVYLANRVVHMLPQKLSNDLCSLKEKEDRLTFSVIIKINKQGTIKDYSIEKSVINSKRRFTYEEVQKIIDSKKGEFSEIISMMNNLAKKLTSKRLKEGSLDFETREPKFIFDEKGKLKDIKIYDRLDSMRMIEEFMLLANKCVTEYVKELSKSERRQYEFIYRVHDYPDPEKLNDLTEYIEQFGYDFNINEKDSINRLLEMIKGKPEEYIINNLLIRSMAKAIYTNKNIGHYGLGFQYYTHFTSPIRRYPDLIVHRILKEYLFNNKNINKKILELRKSLPDICKHTSETEQNAVYAEREYSKLLQIKYLTSHIGDEFEGVISGMTSFGMFVELDNIMAEGLIRFRDIEDDFYEYDEKRHCAVGRRRRKEFHSGQKVKVQIINASLETKKIDLILIDN
jgi:ribonuclease R